MIRLSKRTDYGLMAIRRLSSIPAGSFLSAREIAAQYSIPQALMAKLLQRLTRSGLVASHHGTKGGYQITRPASEISLWEIIEAIEGPICFTECLDPVKGDCPQGTTCTVQRPLLAVHRRITRVLEDTMLRDL